MTRYIPWIAAALIVTGCSPTTQSPNRSDQLIEAESASGELIPTSAKDPADEGISDQLVAPPEDEVNPEAEAEETAEAAAETIVIRDITAEETNTASETESTTSRTTASTTGRPSSSALDIVTRPSTEVSTPETKPSPETSTPASRVPAQIRQPLDEAIRIMSRVIGTASESLTRTPTATTEPEPTVEPEPEPEPEPTIEPEPEPEPEPRERTTTEVLRAVEGLRGLQGWTVVPLGHFQRGERHAMVVWPALNASGRLVDATVVGVCLEEGDDGQLEECGRRWVVTDQARSRASLVEALGGSDYRIRLSRSGAPLDDLGPRMSQLGTSFTSAVSSGNRSGARQAAMSFARLLPLSQAAFDNEVAQLLYLAANYNGRLEHTGTVQSGDTATLTFAVRRSILRIRTVTVTARPVSPGSDRWIATSYR